MLKNYTHRYCFVDKKCKPLLDQRKWNLNVHYGDYSGVSEIVWSNNHNEMILPLWYYLIYFSLIHYSSQLCFVNRESRPVRDYRWSLQFNATINILVEKLALDFNVSFNNSIFSVIFIYLAINGGKLKRDSNNFLEQIMKIVTYSVIM